MLPGDITATVITASFASISGTPQNGSVTLDPGQRILDAGGRLVMEAPAVQQVQGGVMVPVALPNTGQDGLNPSDFTYTATVNVGGTTYSFSFALPATLGETADLSSLIPVSPPPAATAFASANTWTGPQTFAGGIVLPAGAHSGYVLTSDSEGNGSWQAASGGGAVSSVNTKTGPVVLTAADVGADPAGSAAAMETAASAYTDAETSRAEAAEAGKLAKSANLSDLPSPGTARTSLGLGTAAVHAAADFDTAGAAASAQSAAEAFAASAVAAETSRAQTAEALAAAKSANLSDLASATAARTNLGLGTAATHAAADFDAAGTAAAAQSAAQTFAASAVAAETSRAEAAEAGALQKASNLADLASPATARSSLGLGSAAVQNASAFDTAGSASSAQAASLQKSSNLSDLASASAARANLGLGTAATQPSSAFDASGAAAAAQSAAQSYTDTQTAALAPKASPAFTGTPTAPTPAGADSSTKLATTAFVAAAIPASLPPSGTAGGDLASSYPSPQVTSTHLAAPLPLAQGGTGAATAPAALTALGAAPSASPALTGTPTAPTASALTNSTQVATTAYADSAVAAEKTRALAAEALAVPASRSLALANNAYATLLQWTVTAQTDSPPAFGIVTGSQTYGGIQGPAFWMGVNPALLSNQVSSAAWGAMGMSCFADAGDTAVSGAHGLEFNAGCFVTPDGSKRTNGVEVVAVNDNSNTVNTVIRCGTGAETGTGVSGSGIYFENADASLLFALMSPTVLSGSPGVKLYQPAQIAPAAGSADLTLTGPGSSGGARLFLNAGASGLAEVAYQAAGVTSWITYALGTPYWVVQDTNGRAHITLTSGTSAPNALTEFSSKVKVDSDLTVQGNLILASPIADPLNLGCAANFLPGSCLPVAGTAIVAGYGFYTRLISGGYSFSSLVFYVSTSSGNISVAAYANSGSTAVTATPTGGQLATSGAVPCPAVGLATVSLGATITPKIGDWVALSADNATAAVYRADATNGPSYLNINGWGLYQAAAHPLPSVPSGYAPSAAFGGFLMRGA